MAGHGDRRLNLHREIFPNSPLSERVEWIIVWQGPSLSELLHLFQSVSVVLPLFIIPILSVMKFFQTMNQSSFSAADIGHFDFLFPLGYFLRSLSRIAIRPLAPNRDDFISNGIIRFV